MTNPANVTGLVDQSLTLFAECDPSSNDPQLSEAWGLLMGLSQMSGARLLESGFGGLIGAADEVQLYYGQLERVAKIAHDAPFKVPSIALRPLKAAGRFVENTRELDEVCALLLMTPQICAGLAEYLTRTAGRQARPAIDVLDLAVRAGSVYRDSLVRSIPTNAL